MRTLVLVLFMVGALGTMADLLLIGHYEDGWQLVPVFILGAGALAGAGAGVAGGALPVRVFQAIALLTIAAGVIGLWLHWQANSEFEREVSPSLSGLAFAWKAMRGASPPSAAPGTLIHLGLLGLVFVWHHPALVGSRVPHRESPRT